ncbi:MAG: hypothetical protein JNK05_24400 [Myxococcales bacterium]|nr:hypothetical protein [Myxococcales bacterium]
MTMQRGHELRAALHDDLRELVEGRRMSARDARILAAARRRFESSASEPPRVLSFSSAIRALADAVADEIPSGLLFDLGAASGSSRVEGQWVVGSAISHIGLVECHDGAIAIVRARPRCATELLAEFAL